MINLVYFKTLLSIVEWKHVLSKIFPDYIYKFYTFFLWTLWWGISKTKDKLKSINSPWMSKDRVQL